MTPIQFKTLRRKHKATIIELATVVGIDSERLAAWEMGLEALPTETIEMLTEAVKNFVDLRKQWFLQSLEPWMSGADPSEIE